MQHSVETVSLTLCDNNSVEFIIELDNVWSSTLGCHRQLLDVLQLQITAMETISYRRPTNVNFNYADLEVIADLDDATILEKVGPHTLMTSICKNGIGIIGGRAVR